MNAPGTIVRSRPCGFTLTELLIAIGLLGIFMIAATKLFHATFRIADAATQQQNAANSFDFAMSAVRADAWSAAEILTPDETTARLGQVTWSIRNSMLVREDADAEGAAPVTWPAPQGMTFSADGVSLLICVPADRSERGGTFRLVSQPLLLARLASG